MVNNQVYNKLCIPSVACWESLLERVIDIRPRMLRDQADTILLNVLSNRQQMRFFILTCQHLSTPAPSSTTLRQLSMRRLLTSSTWRYTDSSQSIRQHLRYTAGRSQSLCIVQENSVVLKQLQRKRLVRIGNQLGIKGSTKTGDCTDSQA